MKASELRIGNWVHVSDDGHGNAYDEQCTVLHIDYLANGGTNIDPIPLTEEWLEKFGFNPPETIAFIPEWWHMRMTGALVPQEDGYGYAFDSGHSPTVIVKYFHQLQNLFYCLCGEELCEK